ncbi:MAG: glycoside hydrolase family 6 protein [Tsuneonella suprasediminis]
MMGAMSGYLSLLAGAALSVTVPDHGQPALFTNPESTTRTAAERLEGDARQDALTLSRFPSATWFAGGTPDEIEKGVGRLVGLAAAENSIPVLVAYNIPERDCALYSSGGADETESYLAWIKAFSAGIANRPAIVVLEPDSLGIIPWYSSLDGSLGQCQPQGGDKNKAASNRFIQLTTAVDILSSLPNVQVYLDGTGSSWLAPGEAAHRLIQANVLKADGYFLNVSNFESDARVTAYARWISDCIALVTGRNVDPRECPSQYSPATFDDVETWRATDVAYDALFARFNLTRDPASQKRAIIDTSRNGRGSWAPKVGLHSDPEVWCNPPARGLGRRPTMETRHPYIDAFLWIKIPGESDGECFRGTSGPNDPERGINAPPAGSWFPEQARELIRYAVPPLTDSQRPKSKEGER